MLVERTKSSVATLTMYHLETMAYTGKDESVLKAKGVRAWNDWRARHPGTWPDLVGADFRGMDLRGVNLFTADLRSADLSGCNLESADLGGSIMIWTNLTDTNLQRASLYMANMNGAVLNGADLSFATMVETILVDVDLRNVHGLEEVVHLGRSHIGIDTVLRSQGAISPKFLAGTGMSEAVLKRVLTFEEPRPKHHSCFISYSSVDEIFAQRLHRDLIDKGVRCWFAVEDMKTGANVRVSLDEAISEHDKLLLVLSQTSVKSQWVEQEVEKALERERRENRLVLFPVRIDDTVFSVSAGWASLVKNSRHIGDFRSWQDDAAYKKAISRLLRDLRTEEVG